MKRNTILHNYIALWLMASLAAVPMVVGAAGNTVVSNNTLPTGGSSITKNHTGFDTNTNHVMNITQTGKNGIITWKDFSIGANATVNFKGEDYFNTLNYVTGSNMSQIYGKMNANNNGNIYLVNPNGVQIGNSAQINVGSLYVSTKKIDDIDKWNVNTNIEESLRSVNTLNNAQLMSLGYVTANTVTFEGKRVIIDMDRLQTPALKSDTDTPNIHVVSIRDDTEGDYASTKSDNRFYDVVLGTETGKSGDWEKKFDFRNVKETDLNVEGAVTRGDSKAPNPVNADETLAQYFTYRWIKSGNELSQIGNDLNGHYALRNAIDLTEKDQTPIGSSKNPFAGKFDGLGYNIFGLSIKNNNNNNNTATGLFGYTNGAIIGHVNLIAGTNGTSIYGKDDTGALIGHAVDTQVRYVTSTLEVEGEKHTGGLIGYAEQTKNSDTMKKSILNNLINTGTIHGGQYVGGIVGFMNGGTLGVGERGSIDDEETHNLGKITGKESDVGGIVGHAENAIIGGIQGVQKDNKGKVTGFTNNTEAIYNGSAVEGKYNVGGIVGSAENTTIQNIRNESTVKATGFTTETYYYHEGSKPDYDTVENVHMANAGGVVGTISDGTINDALNDGNITSDVDKTYVDKTYVNKKDADKKDVDTTDTVYPHRYRGGNIGGIAGKADNTNMTNVTNKEANIRGAMNVGGVAGYYGNSSTDQTYRIQNGQNDGGDILATGGVTDSDFAQEKANSRQEKYIIGNIGGITGILFGQNIHIEESVNRGNVHTPDVNGNTVPLTSKAANVGGIAGKIDEPFMTKELSAQGRLDNIKKNVADASISGSVNNGNVEGYVNIGGIAGFTFNGSIASSYNLGNITTTRKADAGIAQINLGGILGDSTELGIGRAVLYDVYNKGQVGSQEYTKYYGRHVGGIVGRLSGLIEKAYNTGDIYNGYNVVGGIVGYWYNGAIRNVFNTGNITVYNNSSGYTSEVGGIIGGATVNGGNDTNGSTQVMTLANVYNLGIVRSDGIPGNINTVGGLIGEVTNYGKSTTGRGLQISNGYTVGRLYENSGKAGALIGNFGRNTSSSDVTMENLFYIESDDQKSDGKPIGFIATDNLTTDISYKNNGYTVISANESKNQKAYSGLHFSKQEDGEVKFGDGRDENDTWRNDTWRIVEGSTLPMLNAFLPGSENYFKYNKNYSDLMDKTSKGTLQYGTEYNPLLTIIRSNSDKTVSFDWNDLGLKNNGSIAVIGNVIGNDNYTPGLTLNGMNITDPTGIFGGEIYTTGALTIKGDGNHDLQFGGGSTLHAGSISIDARGKVLKSSGEIHAVGKNGTDLGDVTLTGGEVRLYGIVKTSKDALDSSDTTRIPGISGIDSSYSPTYWDGIQLSKFISDGTDGKLTSLTNLGQLYSLAIDESGKKNGDLNINGTNGVSIMYGNQKQGRTEVGGNLYVTSDQGDIYMDSDYTIGHGEKENTGKLNFTGNKNIILDLTNIGGQVTEADKAKAIQSFLKAHSTKAHGITAGNGSDSEGIKIAIDAWNSKYQFKDKDGTSIDDVIGNFDYKQYDYTDDGDHEFLNALWKLSVTANGTSYGGPQGTDKTGEVNSIHDIFYTFISSAEQLNGIQHYVEKSPYGPSGNNEFDILKTNFLLKNDIDASGLVGAGGKTTYETIAKGKNKYGKEQSYAGTFDGLGNRIIGLTADKGLIANNSGTVQNLKIYSSVFTGQDAGAVVSKNTGTISNVIGLGNSIMGNGSIGGMVGINQGRMENLSDQSTVIAGENAAAGGIAGTNQGYISNAQTNSAVTTNINRAGGKSSQMGGIVGVNYDGNEKVVGISNVSAHGVTGKESRTETAGGIVGMNYGTISEAYNESVLSGSSGIGGIAGINRNDGNKTASISNVANAVEIIGDAGSKNIGGLVGNQQSGTISDGRNTGTISGGQNVGGMVGTNGNYSTLKNLENGSVAKITGVQNVGGIAGVNEGTISAENQSNLFNKGEIYGWENVGGIAGKNSGTIDNVNSDIYLHIIGDAEKDQLKGSLAVSANAQYFGGVTGENVGTITNATNRATVDAAKATYVGGIAGKNAEKGKLQGMGNSNQGKVIGKNYVGGVIGKNEVAISGTKIDGVGVTNSGMVIATSGGAGGIIGENNANISYTVMKNEGEVHGNASENGTTQENGTGGIIGVNGKDASITNSSMMNTLNGKVTGISNVGGLIGINHGTVTGGRDSKDGYYQHQIYNNGTIQAGSYDEKTGTLNTEITGSKNIGGLIGDNVGALTAGYNTGVITAGSSINVGGIAGSNSGRIDQVFTNVMTENKQDQTITGASNVGGIVGNNATNDATISNAYTAQDTTVNGKRCTGLIAGKNQGTISNVYGSNANPLVGNGTNATNGYGMSNKETDYKGFNFTGSDDKSAIWKIYEDHTNPLLKVFLTKANVKEDALKNLVYNGQNQLDIHKLITDNILTNQKDANFADFTQSSSLLSSNASKNAGTYTKWLWSAQIGKNDTEDFNPNNLGYDFTVDDVTIKKKTLTATDFAASIVYGNQDGKGWQIGKRGTLNGIVSGDDVSLDWNGQWSEGESYVKNKANRDTANAGIYNNGMKVTGIGLQGTQSGNYTISSEATGDLTVEKAKLEVSLKDISRVYGNRDNKDYSKAFEYKKGTTLVNGDSGLTVAVTNDGAIEDGTPTDVKKTQDVGEYTWTGKLGDVDNLNTNYNIIFTDSAKSNVTKAALHVHTDDQTIMMGQKPKYTGTIEGFVNGDSEKTLGALQYGIDDARYEQQVGTHLGVIRTVNGTDGELPVSYDRNYKIMYDWGNLIVRPYTRPSVTPATGRFDYLFYDTPWDKQRNFRERRAELHFVDGGINME